MTKLFSVIITSKAEKQLRKLPKHIKECVAIWAASVEEIGIRRVRLMAGYHDEPLVGLRGGQRSVRLNRSYRLFYVEDERIGSIMIIVLEVNKHEYK